MAITEQEMKTWGIGAQGEELFARALHKAGLLGEGFLWLRNLRFGDGPGDLDCLVFGPTGVWLWDVKHWAKSTVYTSRAGVAADNTKLEAGYVVHVLGDVLPEDGVNVGWAMTLERVPGQVEGIPMCTPDEAIEMMRQGPQVMTKNEVWNMVAIAKRRFTFLGSPTPR